jgi:ABC-type dipeptide/oligopeptide/nickel transport system permease subunit
MDRKKAKKWVVAIATVVLGFSLALDLVSWPAFARLLWKDIIAAASTPWIHFAITIGCALLALLLYGARSVAPQVYGIAEILVGLAVCWGGLSPTPFGES